MLRPRLPVGLDWLVLSGMRVGGSTVDLRFERVSHDGGARAQAHVRSGGITVIATEERSAPDDFQ